MKLRHLGVPLMILLTACGAQDPSATNSPAASTSTTTTSTPTPKPTPAPPTPAVLSTKDRATLRATLGPDPSRICARADRVTCGKAYATTARRVDAALVLLKKMPKTKPYREIALSGAYFKNVYRETTEQGCFTGAQQDRVGADFCLLKLLSAASAYRSFTDHLAP